MPSYLSKFLGNRVHQLLKQNKNKSKQGTEEWHRFRYNHLNASEGYAVLSTEQLGKTYKQLVKEKCEPFVAPGPIEDPYFIRGHAQEPVIRKLYSKMTGSVVHDGFGSFQHYKYPFLAASVDGITDRGVVVEIKSRSKVFAEPPFRDWVQVQLQLEIMNLNEADYVQAQLVPVKKGKGSRKGTIDGYRVVEYKCINIKRNHDWFKKEALPKFQAFWTMVKTHRTAGTIPELDPGWVVAHDIRNYSLGDPLIDYLEKYHRPRKHIDRTPEYDFNNFFCKKGIEFEDMVVKELQQQFEDDFYTVWRTGQPIDDSVFSKTSEAMERKVPILYHAPIRDNHKKTWGIPDLLVRGDYLGLIIQHPLSFTVEMMKYYIVDIKLGVLDLTANGEHLYNNTKTRAYKGQLGFYNEILKTYHGHEGVSTAFIIGRKWHYVSKRVNYSGNHWYERYGVIDFADFDSDIIEIVTNAISWVRKLRTESNSWTLDPPSCPELRPNMKNDEDSAWRYLKEQLAIKNGEITLLWQCGVKNRDIAQLNGIESIHDANITAEKIGITGPYKSRILNTIIQANQQTDPLYIRDIEILQPPGAPWLNNDYYKIFLDYETISDLVEPSIEGDLIFMIGAWHGGQYKCWVTDHITRSDELVIARQFFDWLSEIKRKMGQVAIYYWSKFEATQTEKLIERHQLTAGGVTWRECIRYDLCEELQDSHIGARGAYNYKLKKFTNALYQNKAIKTHWGDNECSDGLKAMVMTYYLNQKGGSLKNKKEMKDIIEYNKIDCKSMYSILEYIKKCIQ